ncbi:hypothetical protein K525DRAFT_274349 [Schizophyllum commune Loenen D]|nr:hypothetical protein K525DRAFT_274349 [Schizophyllum commune Loenen D]
MNQNRPLPGTDANGKEMARKPHQEEQTRGPYQEEARRPYKGEARKPYQEDAFKYCTDNTRAGTDNTHPPPPLNTTKPPYSRRPSDPVHAPHRDAYTAQHNEALRMALGSILSPVSERFLLKEFDIVLLKEFDIVLKELAIVLLKVFDIVLSTELGCQSPVKRPFTPSSTSHPASGTASPAFFHALPFTGTGPHSATSTGPTTGAQTPSDAMHGSPHPQQHAHTHHLYPHWPGSYHHPHPPEPRQYHSDPQHPYHPHTPSRLGAGEEGPVERGHAGEAGEFRQGGHGPIHDSSHPPSPGEPATPPAVDNLHVPAPVPVASASPHSALPSGGVHPAAAHAGDGSPSSGAGTPRAKFLDTLQGKSAWDALIHGSFS